MLDLTFTPAALAGVLVEAYAEQGAQLVGIERPSTHADPAYGEPIYVLIAKRLLVGVWTAQHFFLLDAYEWNAETHQAESLSLTLTVDMAYERESQANVLASIKDNLIARALDALARRDARRKHATEVTAVAQRLAVHLPREETYWEQDESEASVTIWHNRVDLSGVSMQLAVNWSPLNNAAGVAVDVSLTGLREEEARQVLLLLRQLRAQRALKAQRVSSAPATQAGNASVPC